MKISNKNEQISIIIDEHLLGGYEKSIVIEKNGLLYIDDVNEIEENEKLGYKYLGTIEGHNIGKIYKQLEEMTKEN